ncbi:MAG: hypothetical protein KJ709_08550 [Nanoarchaeota archaeon]|nr:hypothetical protein [Nanoarchaeota archaeon]
MKAQMEILGLAFVIMFIAVGMLFVIKFVLMPSESPRQDFTRTQLAYNTINALLHTDSECAGMSFRDLLIACADGSEVTCGDTLDPVCTYAANTIKDPILTSTLDAWEFEYEFDAYTIDSVSSDEISIFSNPLSNGECDEWKSARFPLQTQTAGTMFVELKMCG